MIAIGYDDIVCDWVSAQLFGRTGRFDRNCRAIGVENDKGLIAGVVYSNYRTKPDGNGLTVEMSIASIDKSWCTKSNLRTFFSYPFIQLDLERVQTTCSANEPDVIAFNKRLGFVHEGTHRKAWSLGGDALSWSMLKDECKWIKNGKVCWNTRRN